MITTSVHPKLIHPQDIEWLVPEIMAQSNPVVDYHEHEGVWVDQGLVAKIHEWDWYADSTARIRECLTTKLRPYLGAFEVDKSHILNAQLPWEVHNDYEILCGSRTNSPQAVVIIPLSDAPSKTYVFDQGAPYGSFARYRDENPPRKDCVPVDIWNQDLSHCWPRDRFWLTIAQVFEWQQGDVCIFDRQTWHASDSFHNRGLDSKQAIVLFTGYPNV